ncbi:hypothetical protein HK100_005450, partial [Physocladia obscura]
HQHMKYGIQPAKKVPTIKTLCLSSTICFLSNKFCAAGVPAKSTVVDALPAPFPRFDSATLTAETPLMGKLIR